MHESNHGRCRPFSLKGFDGFSAAGPTMPAVDFFDARTVGAGPFDIDPPFETSHLRFSFLICG